MSVMRNDTVCSSNYDERMRVSLFSLCLDLDVLCDVGMVSHGP